MKNSILIVAALLFIGATMTSCKKNYTCTCSKTYTSGSGSTTLNYAEYTYNENAKRANDRCNDNEKTSSDFWGDYAVNCDLK